MSPPQQAAHAHNLLRMTSSRNVTRRRVKLCEYTKVLLSDIGKECTFHLVLSKPFSREPLYRVRDEIVGGDYCSVSKFSKIIAEI